MVADAGHGARAIADPNELFASGDKDATDDRRVLAQHDCPPVLADESGLDWDIDDFRLPGARAGQNRSLVRARYYRDRQFAILADRVGVLERVVARGRSGDGRRTDRDGSAVQSAGAIGAKHPDAFVGDVAETGRGVWREVRIESGGGRSHDAGICGRERVGSVQTGVIVCKRGRACSRAGDEQNEIWSSLTISRPVTGLRDM